MDHLLKKYEDDYSPWLGRPWKQQRGGGCFTLIYDYMKETGVQEFSQDYSLTVRQYKIEDIEREGWSIVFEKEEGDSEFNPDILKKNDVICFSFGTDKIKHAAIYIESYIPLIRYILRKNE